MFAGLLENLKDEATRSTGEFTKPLFEWLRTEGPPGLRAALPGINPTLEDVFAWIGENGPKAFARSSEA
jgi:hypothetical protein